MNRTTVHKNFSFNRRFQQDGLAGLISDLVNPLMLPPIVIGLTGWLLSLPTASILSVTFISLFFYTLGPVLAAFYLLKKNKITSVDLPRRRSRNRLFLFSIASAAAAFLCLSNISAFTHPLLGTLAFIFLLNPCVGLLINLKWKMSIHTAALSTTGAIFFMLSYLNVLGPISGNILPALILLLLLPLVIWARYRLNIHSLSELFGGALLGFMLTLVEFTLLIKVW